MMDRRALIIGGVGALAAPLAAGAQQARKVARLGVLLFGTPATNPNLAVFVDGLRELLSGAKMSTFDRGLRG